ncbi:MAG TPA: GNAT family N-acetyltransferase [Chitinophagaceae bacterium]|nr:GNAT family N-acetyltransferase [Chitinophagaceae bacterium]
MYEVREASVSDAGIIRQLAYDTWPSAYGNILSDEQISYMLKLFYSEPSLLHQMQAQLHRFLILYRDGQPVGFASFSPKAGGPHGLFRLHKLYVLPSEQGKGGGKKLMDGLFQIIKASSATAIECNVNRFNPAKLFYERLGFRVEREEDIDIGNGYWMNDYVMRKDV